MNHSELLYIGLARIVVGVNVAPLEELSIRFVLGWIQIDNPSVSAAFPTVLRPVYDKFFQPDTLLAEYEPDLLRVFDVPPEFSAISISLSIRITSMGASLALDLPLLQVYLAALSVSVDYDIIARLLTFVDNVISESQWFAIIERDGNCISVSETDRRSPEWASLLGPAENITNVGGSGGIMMSVESLEIGQLTIILNVMTEKSWEPKATKVI